MDLLSQSTITCHPINMTVILKSNHQIPNMVTETSRILGKTQKLKALDHNYQLYSYQYQIPVIAPLTSC